MFYAKHRSRRKKMKFVKGIAMLLCLVTIFTSVWFTGNIVMAEDGVSNAELYELLIKAESKSEFDTICNRLSDDEISEFEKWLGDNEKMDELQAHITDLYSKEPIPETVVFTEAGPFLPAVDVNHRKGLLAASKKSYDNGIFLNKVVKKNDDGTYTITLESFTTGDVKTTIKTTPVDIVLVIDQSGSMAYDFEGKNTSNVQNRRQYAMKQAVESFINAVNGKYTDEADHRMALVTFGDNASLLQGWTTVDETGANSLIAKINGLSDSPSGATNAGAGMQQAETLMGSGYNYTGSNTTRQKVVVLFTDGVPTTGSEFDQDNADTAISAAKSLKDNGTTVYTVGIFNGANPDEMYGSAGFDTNSNGTIGSEWIKDTWGLFPGTDFPETDRPAVNRFMNLLSSNYYEASSLGLIRQTSGLGVLHYKITYTITQNFNRNSDNYYLTASNSSSLNTIFKQISEQIGTPDIELGTETVIKDIISDYFELPVGMTPNDIKVYTALAKATAHDNPENENSWAERVSAGLTPVINEKTISVSGFNFNENYVAIEGRGENKDFYGKKLIIEFTVKVRDGFLGGNGVPTNDAKSGVYEDSESDTPLFTFDQPTVDVEIPEITSVFAVDKNIYLLQKPTDSQLKNGMRIMCGNIDITDPAKLAGWQIAYVNISSLVKTNTAFDATKDGTYTITATLSPKESGTVAAKSKQSNEAKINVFVPELTFKDGESYYGADVPNDFSGHKTAERWTHGETIDSSVTMIGTKPELAIAYTPDSTMIQNGKYAANGDLPVKVTVKISDSDVTDKVIFKHISCTPSCSWSYADAHGAPAFVIHFKYANLTIKKSGCEEIDENQSFIFRIKGNENDENTNSIDLTVVIKGNGKITIADLPVGNYTVTEETSWSWRYTPDEASKNVDLEPEGDSVEFKNTRSDDKWLSGDAHKPNKYN